MYISNCVLVVGTEVVGKNSIITKYCEAALRLLICYECIL